MATVTYSANPPPQGYEEAIRDYRILSSRACAVVVIVLILLGAVLDYLVYPAYLHHFGLARLVAGGLIGAALISSYTAFGKRHVKGITFAWLLVPQAMISWMIFATDGESSLFYAGLILTVFAIGSLFPVGYLTTVAYGVATLVLYTVACIAHNQGIQHLHEFLYHAVIIAFAVAGSSVFTFFNERGRHQLYRLREEVALKNGELERINEKLVQIKGQMLQQEKMAAIGTLSAGLLHEVNNPVNFCLMAIEIAREEPEAKRNPSLMECLDDARQGMQRIQAIVSDLKTFAHRTPGAEAPQVPFMLARAIDSAVRLTGHELKGITITRSLPADTLVKGDEAAIVGVLINLLSNAALELRNAGQEAPAIDLSATWREQRLQVVVRDNGVGIPAANITRIFEPFFTTRGVGQGLGLGLSISYRVIDQHGGTLAAESVVGEWTKMTFDLPQG